MSLLLLPALARTAFVRAAQLRDPRRAVARACAALLPLALAACMSTPIPDQTPPLPAQWRNAPADAAAAPAAAPDPRGWWRAFADPRLDALVEQALAANLDAAQARARLRSARLLHEHAGDPLKPELRARTSNPIDPDASASFFVMGLDAVWEMGFFGRSEALERGARSELDSAAAQLRQAQISVAAETAREWVALRDARERERLLDGIRAARAEQLRVQQVRADLRLAARDSVEAPRAALAQAEAALGEPRQRVVAAEQALAVLLGRAEPDPDWRAGGARPALAAAAIERAPADLLRTRPDIAQAQAAVLRAAADLGLARADQYPRLAFGTSIQWSVNVTAHRRTETEGIGVSGPIIDVPLFDWGLRRARAHAKGAELEAAALAYRKTVLAAVAETESALSALEQQRLREDADRRAFDALARSAQMQQVRRGLGLGGDAELAASRIERDQAALELNAARSDRAQAYIALYKALGAAPEQRLGRGEDAAGATAANQAATAPRTARAAGARR
ncbi:TolC family protein [Lysobacter enzymogenes]|uniref:TolC family protein n=1 Tax=Lysobacter enzymogenes TaxID=69 RepID=UPI0037493FE2